MSFADSSPVLDEFKNKQAETRGQEQHDHFQIDDGDEEWIEFQKQARLKDHLQIDFAFDDADETDEDSAEIAGQEGASTKHVHGDQIISISIFAGVMLLVCATLYCLRKNKGPVVPAQQSASYGTV